MLSSNKLYHAVQKLLRAGADNSSGPDLEEMQCACSLTLLVSCPSMSSSGGGLTDQQVLMLS